VKIPETSLLITFGKPGRTQCFMDRLSGLRLSDNDLFVEIEAHKANCVSIAQPTAGPVLLIAVPLDELPHRIIDVQLHRFGDAEEQSHFPWNWSAVADLRSPAASQSMPARDIQAGIDAAWAAMPVEKWELSEVAVRRWKPGDSPCAIPATTTAGAADPLGIVIRVVFVPNDGRNLWVARQHEFTWRPGQGSLLDDCGVIPSR
jgi:hypothetical protein